NNSSSFSTRNYIKAKEMPAIEVVNVEEVQIGFKYRDENNIESLWSMTDTGEKMKQSCRKKNISFNQSIYFVLEKLNLSKSEYKDDFFEDYLCLGEWSDDAYYVAMKTYGEPRDSLEKGSGFLKMDVAVNFRNIKDVVELDEITVEVLYYDNSAVGRQILLFGSHVLQGQKFSLNGNSRTFSTDISIFKVGLDSSLIKDIVVKRAQLLIRVVDFKLRHRNSEIKSFKKITETIRKNRARVVLNNSLGHEIYYVNKGMRLEEFLRELDHGIKFDVNGGLLNLYGDVHKADFKGSLDEIYQNTNGGWVLSHKLTSKLFPGESYNVLFVKGTDLAVANRKLINSAEKISFNSNYDLTQVKSGDEIILDITAKKHVPQYGDHWTRLRDRCFDIGDGSSASDTKLCEVIRKSFLSYLSGPLFLNQQTRLRLNIGGKDFLVTDSMPNGRLPVFFDNGKRMIVRFKVTRKMVQIGLKKLKFRVLPDPGARGQLVGFIGYGICEFDSRCVKYGAKPLSGRSTHDNSILESYTMNVKVVGLPND
ncbi:MAG: hypothetical protein KAQ98_04650, partial [Bacteriovoracaceae bacterium]|nr:hypothetical protein [Bacteriovoracaceae bacterium]